MDVNGYLPLNPGRGRTELALRANLEPCPAGKFRLARGRVQTTQALRANLDLARGRGRTAHALRANPSWEPGLTPFGSGVILKYA